VSEPVPVIDAAAPIPILLMVRELTLGGSERQLTEIAKALDRSRFEPHVGCFRPIGIRGDELRAAGVSIVAFPVRSFRHPSVLQAARLLRRYVRLHRVQVVHTFDVPATLFGILSASMLDGVATLSSQRASRELTPGLTRRLLRITDRLADGVVVNCKAMQRELTDEEHVPSELVHLCYNGIDAEAFLPPERERPSRASGADVTIGVVCALRPEKDLETLLQAFANVRRVNAAIRLVIVGSGPSLQKLQACAGALHIAGDCTFEPATTRVVEWLRAIDVFVLPSRSEALSNSLMEAMACGCAVVASRIGGNVELVEDGRTGALFETGDVAQLSAILQRLAGDAALRKALGSAATRLVRERFSLPQSAARMAQIYSTVIAASRR
jgi:glycosyltransferase involved in cell wall biosynthesis